MNVKVDAFEKDEMKFVNLGFHIWLKAHYDGQRLSSQILLFKTTCF